MADAKAAWDALVHQHGGVGTSWPFWTPAASYGAYSARFPAATAPGADKVPRQAAKASGAFTYLLAPAAVQSAFTAKLQPTKTETPTPTDGMSKFLSDFERYAKWVGIGLTVATVAGLFFRARGRR